MQFEQLRALAAVVDAGTFEAAARTLQVTPSAVSQRIKALESEVGRVLVRRETPCAVTVAGEPVLRMARQVGTLEQDTRRALGLGTGERVGLPVAVNADSLATWFAPLLDDAAGWDDVSLLLRVEDQEHTAAMLRGGDVVAAVTADPRPVAGCRVSALGAMRYLPVATREVQCRYLSQGRMRWDAMPLVRFNAKDTLQADVLRELAPDVRPPHHEVPDATSYAAALRAGLGWGLLPESQVEGVLDAGSLVLLHDSAHRDVALYWQRWRLGSRPMNRLTEAVTHAARVLRRVEG